MATNLLDVLKGTVTPELLSAASSRWGESESGISKGLLAAFPMMLAALMQKLNDPNLMSRMVRWLTSHSNSADVLAHPRSALPGEPASSGLMELGTNLLSAAFGTHTGAVSNALAQYAGIKNTSASSVMTLASTLVAGALSDRVRCDDLNATGLATLLSGQRESILDALPGALSSIPGLGSLRDVGDATDRTRHSEQGSPAWLWAAAAAIVLALGGWWLLGDGEAVRGPATDAVRAADQRAQQGGDAARRAGQVAGDAPQAASDTVRDWHMAVSRLGSFQTRRLPTNVEISIPERGVERDFIAYLGDPAKAADPVLWFNFDRLLFETGSAGLKPQSQEQLRAVAEILKAYPTAQVKIGGYTDNVGDPAANLKLSQDRALSVRNAIIGLGVPSARLDAEGFGEEFPVADNSTPEGRQQNRRIAMRVMAK